MASLLVVLCLFAAEGPSDQKHRKAMEIFYRADFVRAVELLKEDLIVQQGGPREKETRELLVLALFNVDRKDEAFAAYEALLVRFPRFVFDPNAVLPETIEFFTARVAAKREAERKAAEKRAAEKPASAPVVIVAPPAKTNEQQPIVLKEPEHRFHWYYLTPLGIGQFLAKSPVRGSLFLILEAGFLALNLASYYVMYQPEMDGAGGFRNVDRARTGLVLTNVAFAGLIATAIAAVIDAACCERD